MTTFGFFLAPVLTAMVAALGLLFATMVTALGLLFPAMRICRCRGGRIRLLLAEEHHRSATNRTGGDDSPDSHDDQLFLLLFGFVLRGRRGGLLAFVRGLLFFFFVRHGSSRGRNDAQIFRNDAIDWLGSGKSTGHIQIACQVPRSVN